MRSWQEKKFLHALLSAGIEYDALKKIFTRFGSCEAAWQGNLYEFENAGLSQESVRRISNAKDNFDPDEAMRALVSENTALVSRDDPEFPSELREIAASPFALYIKGGIPKGIPRIAVVGTRKATAYGREATRKIVTGLAGQTNIAIVSGLASGIDAEAHRSALESGLPTIGVLGGGMDRGSFFPPENWQMAEEIVRKGGAIISEYPPGAPPLKHHFPARNRIISGLSSGVIVVEAPERSGALITARFALEQNREVFAVPGPLFNPNSAGTHRLIREGAALAASSDDIIEELSLPRHIMPAKNTADLTEGTERTIFDLLSAPASIDELIEKTSMPAPAVISCLSLLELKGFIRPMGQNKFQRIVNI